MSKTNSCMIEKYRIVQCFSLVLKLDVFFEFVFFLILNYSANYNESNRTMYILTSIIALISIFVAREAIARESRILMILFLFMQIGFSVVLIYFMVYHHGRNTKYLFSAWYNFAMCCKYIIK
jgi:hypothetical protein